MKVSVKVLGLNKSEVHLGRGTVVFFSYQTPVAAVHGDTYYETSRTYSRTTTKHISQWEHPKCAKSTRAPEEFMASLIPRVVMEEQASDVIESLKVIRSALVPHMGILPNLVIQKITQSLNALSTEKEEE